ncbi:MAG: putative Ig domain-containing protein [Dehalococcoidales bacterium]|nr:putative Ig domain-containing protein [Dehalococcoidales bacterium]
MQYRENQLIRGAILTSIILFTFTVMLIYTGTKVTEKTVNQPPMPVPAINLSPVLETIGNKTVSQGSLIKFTVRASDSENDNLTYTASNLPPGATLNSVTRVFSFVPESVGTYDDVIFSVSDGQVTVSETVSITVLSLFPAPVTQQSPALETIGNKTVSQGSLIEFTVRANNPENDNLTYTALNLPPGATFNSATRVFSFIPKSVGTYDNVIFSVSDGQSATSQTITISVLSVTPPLLKGLPISTLPLAVFHYGPLFDKTDSLVLGVRPQYLVINTSQGLWAKIGGHRSDVFHNVSKYKAAGIRVIGYITAGYEGTQSGGNIDSKWYTLEMNRKLIQDMALVDGVDGVFIDEISSFPDEKGKAYLKELTDLAHSFGLITWGNVGVNNFDPWFFTKGGFDLMHSSENWHGQDLSKVQLDWGYRISVTGFSPGYTAQDAFNLTVNAWQKGLAYSYITDSSLGYYDLPAWLEEYAELLRQYKLSPGKYQPSSQK